MGLKGATGVMGQPGLIGPTGDPGPKGADGLSTFNFQNLNQFLQIS